MLSNIKTKKINNEIASIIIDEQKTYNSLSFKNLTDLLNVFKKLDSDKKIKVIILEFWRRDYLKILKNLDSIKTIPYLFCKIQM